MVALLFEFSGSTLFHNDLVIAWTFDFNTY